MRERKLKSFFSMMGKMYLSASLINGDIMFMEMFSIQGNCADRGLRLNRYFLGFVPHLCMSLT